MIFFPRSLSKWQWAAADYKVKTQPPTPTQRVTISAASSLTVDDVIKWKHFTVPGEFLTQRPVPRSFDVFFYLRLNKRLSKQSWGWWFETLSHPLWRHRNAKCLILYVLHFRRHLTIPPLEINMVSDHELRTMWLTFQRPLKIRRIRPISGLRHCQQFGSADIGRWYQPNGTSHGDWSSHEGAPVLLPGFVINKIGIPLWPNPD